MRPHAALLALLLAAPSYAASENLQSYDSIVRDVDKCRAIEDAPARAICLDDFAARLHEVQVERDRANAGSKPDQAKAANVDWPARVKAKCEKDWPADFKMQKYCIEQQTEGLNGLRELLPTIEGHPPLVDAFGKCFDEWAEAQDDPKQAFYCVTQQIKAYAELNKK